MGPSTPLPLHPEWEDVDTYLKALLSFATSTPLFLNLCGGVHILDFLTSTPDLYTTLLPQEWRDFFHEHDLYDILDLILTDDISPFTLPNGAGWNQDAEAKWKDGPSPPASLLDYIQNIRLLSLRRDFTSKVTPGTSVIPLRVAVGMKPKKFHEVEQFSKYVDSFSSTISETRQEPVTHIVDFGSGQNYLGRTLAHSYNRHIIAIERKHAYIKGAQGMDVHARMVEKQVRNVNKKAFKRADAKRKVDKAVAEQSVAVDTEAAPEQICTVCPPEDEELVQSQQEEGLEDEEEGGTVFKVFTDLNIGADDLPTIKPKSAVNQKAKEEEILSPQLRGAVSYIEHNIKDGYLEPIIRHVVDPNVVKSEENGVITEATEISSQSSPENKSNDARVMVVSLHSCGNLLHHGIRSLVLNPSVVAIAMIGCCYNLVTERLGPATYKLPVLRHMHQRLAIGAQENDPHGFPMSNLFEQYPYSGGNGIKFNITARMMACQAPYNWSRVESETFFTRHYYRALLQKFFVDHGVVPKPKLATLDVLMQENASFAQEDEGTGVYPPVIIGTLRKTAYKSFVTYAQAAMEKLAKDPAHEAKITPLLNDDKVMTEILEKYLSEYEYSRKNLSIVWLLMAFSASIVESMIVIDRWQFLREHMASGLVKECWVEPVFDYAQSPRNLAVIGIKN